MATNLQIDDQLIKKAVELGRHRTGKEAVTQALVEYIRHLEQERILSLFGSIAQHGSLHYLLKDHPRY